MKRLLFSAAAIVVAITASAQNGVLYQKEMIAPSGNSFLGMEDCIVDPTHSKFVSLIDFSGSSTGTMLVKTDLNSGTVTTGQLYYGLPGHLWTSSRILSIGGNYYTIGGYTSSAPGL